MDNSELIERMERCKRFGDVTANGIVYDWWLVNADGAGFILFREPHHTDADIERAKRHIRNDQDVVGRIQVETIKR